MPDIRFTLPGNDLISLAKTCDLNYSLGFSITLGDLK